MVAAVVQFYFFNGVHHSVGVFQSLEGDTIRAQYYTVFQQYTYQLDTIIINV